MNDHSNDEPGTNGKLKRKEYEQHDADLQALVHDPLLKLDKLDM
jgi:hypothetical protein